MTQAQKVIEREARKAEKSEVWAAMLKTLGDDDPFRDILSMAVALQRASDPDFLDTELARTKLLRFTNAIDAIGDVAERHPWSRIPRMFVLSGQFAKLTRGTKAVYVTLCAVVDARTSSTRVTDKRLAELCNVHPNTAKRAVAELERVGAIVRFRYQAGPTHSRRLIRLNWSAVMDGGEKESVAGKVSGGF